MSASTVLSAGRLVGSNFAFQHYRFEHFLDVMNGFGFTAIELWGVAPHLDLFHEDDARVRRIRRALDDHGLSVVCYTPEQVMYPVNIASGDDRLREASVRRFHRAAEIAAALDAPYLFLTSGRGYEDEPRADAWRRSAESLHAVAEHAAPLGVRCLLEPLQRVESNLVLNAADVRRMLDDVGRDDIDVVLDTVAMATAGDTVAGYVRAFGTRIGHVQLVDGSPSGHLAWGDGSLPLGDYVDELARLGYRGTMTFELFGDGSYALDPVAAWTRCVEGLRPHLAEGVA